MTHATHGDVIVPDIINRPLHRISYFELVGKTLEANPTKDLSRRVLQELWEAIVTKIYDYEYGWRKNKSTEVGSLSYPPVMDAGRSQLL